MQLDDLAFVIITGVPISKRSITMGEFWAFSWVLIPLAGILAGTFKEWLKFKEKQNQLGASTENLEKKVGSLVDALKDSESKRMALVERVQNLETIVTSQDWDFLADDLPLKPVDSAEKNSSILDTHRADEINKINTTNRAAILAKRLNT